MHHQPGISFVCFSVVQCLRLFFFFNKAMEQGDVCDLFTIADLGERSVVGSTPHGGIMSVEEQGQF
jgi:hypothetical protein